MPPAMNLAADSADGECVSTIRDIREIHGKDYGEANKIR